MTQLELLNPSAEMAGRIGTAHDALRFMFAGNATFTIRSTATGVRFTYRVRQAKHDPGRPGYRPTWFVSLLNGPDNDSNFAYMGVVQAEHTARNDGAFKATRNSRVTPDAPSHQAFAWLYGRLRMGVLPTTVEMWHEGRCGRCGRKLTVPESIGAGLGPECVGRMV